MPYITLRQEIMLNLQFNRELMRRIQTQTFLRRNPWEDWLDR